MQPIAEWLVKIGPERYAPAFADNDIDVSLLPHLTDADLEKIGVSLGHRRYIFTDNEFEPLIDERLVAIKQGFDRIRGREPRH